MAFGPTGDATCLRLCARLSIPANARACPHIKPSRRPFRLSALCSNRVEQLREFTRPSPDGNQSVYWVFNVKSIDIISDIIIINTEQRRVEMGNGEKQLLYKAKFSIFDISRVFLERRAK